MVQHRTDRGVSARSDQGNGAGSMMDEGLRIMDQTMRTGLDLFRKGIEAGHAMLEMQARTQDFLVSSLTSWTNQAQAMSQMGNRAFEYWANWTRLAHKTMDQAVSVGREAQQAYQSATTGAGRSNRD